jgi:2-iminobutanoate/2-iminopropanoate deaminase
MALDLDHDTGAWRKRMPKQQISVDSLATPKGHYAQASVVEARGRLVFVSGMTARRPDGSVAGVGDVREQTRQVCENLRSAVEAAGGTLDDVCRIDVFVRNIEDFEAIHAVRREFFRPPLPASTMVEVSKLVSHEYLIEINALAVVPD